MAVMATKESNDDLDAYGEGEGESRMVQFKDEWKKVI